jgi:hypothetical protein
MSLPGFDAIAGKLGGTAEQLFVWQVLGALLGAAMVPAINELQQLAYDAVPNAPISPADAATMVVRGFMSQSDAATEAQLSGVSGSRFQRLVDISGEAPSPSEIAEGVRRGILSWTASQNGMPSGNDGIKEGNLKDVWIPLVQALAVINPTPDAALSAFLKGQVDETTARHLYEVFGGNPDYFTVRYDTEGAGPSPNEAAEMARRGVIPWDGIGPTVTSYEQAVKESQYRNKWAPGFKALANYLPPPRTVTAMLKEGSLTQAEAADLLAKQGLTPDLVKAYLAAASHGKTATHKALTEAQIVTLHEEGLISPADAETALVGLGFSKPDAGYILALADVRREIAQTNAAVSRIRTLYVGYKLTRQEASDALAALHVPASQLGPILDTWDLIHKASPKRLTPAQIVDAWYVQILTVPEAIAELQNDGYSALDAWTLLSIKNKGPLPNRPGG